MTEHVIFACVHNAGRSQMAAAFFDAMARALDDVKRIREEIASRVARLIEAHDWARSASS